METWTKILNAVQVTYLANLDMVRSWQSSLETNFKTSYQVSLEGINGVVNNLHVYLKFVEA